MPRVLTDNAQSFLDDLPPWFTGDSNVQAAIQVMSNEVDRINDQIQEVINTYWPFLADQYLYLWEAALGVSVNPPGLNTAQRQTRCLAFFQQRVFRVYGSSWVAALNTLLGAGWTWYRAGDDSVPAHTIKIVLPYTPTSTQAYDFIELIGLITPANTVIEVAYGEGFIVQQSLIQIQPI